MLKCEIHLDERKILSEGIYEPNEVYRAIDRLFEDCEFIKGKNGFYYGKGNDKDFAHFWSAILTLKNTNWFLNYADKWLWYNSDESDDPENFNVEDILTFYKNKLKEGA